MTEPTTPQRIAIIWSPEARADLRAIDRDDVKKLKLKPPRTSFRLRWGD